MDIIHKAEVVVGALRLQLMASDFMPPVWVVEVIVAKGLFSGNTYRGRFCLPCMLSSNTAALMFILLIEQGH